MVHCAVRCGEHALNAVSEAAIAETGRVGKDYTATTLMVSPYPVSEPDDEDPLASTVLHHVPQAPVANTAVPELTPPGESQSNGLAERSVRTVEEQTRTFLADLEARIQVPIHSDHPILGWIVEHATYVLNKYLLGKDGHTALGRPQGKETSERICEFGERVLWFVPKAVRSKLDQRWRCGVFLGRSISSDQNFIGLPNGNVVRARAIVRLVPEARWRAEFVMKIAVTPLQECPKTFDDIETRDAPHDHPPPDAGSDAKKRRVKITYSDLVTSPTLGYAAVHDSSRFLEALHHTSAVPSWLPHLRCDQEANYPS